MTWDWFVRIILREYLERGVVTDYWCCCILEEVTEKLVGWSNLFARLLENMIINQSASPYTGNPDIAADKSWTRRGIFRVKWMASSELERMGGWWWWSRLLERKRHQLVETGHCWPKRLSSKAEKVFIKGFYCRLCSLEVGLSSFVASFTQVTLVQSHHQISISLLVIFIGKRWLCSPYLGGGILWQSRFLFVIHALPSSPDPQKV